MKYLLKSIIRGSTILMSPQYNPVLLFKVLPIGEERGLLLLLYSSELLLP